MRAILFTAAFAAALATASPTSAHHGWSSYDAEKTIKVSGKLTDLVWGNPHGAAKIAYQGKTWDVILAPVSRMEARGLTKAMIGPGKTITLEGYPRKDGAAEMRVERITSGKTTIELR